MELNQTFRKLRSYMYLSFQNAICKSDRRIKSTKPTKHPKSDRITGRIGRQITTAPVLLFEFKSIRSLLYESLMLPLCASTRKLLLNNGFRVQRLHLDAEFHNFWKSRILSQKIQPWDRHSSAQSQWNWTKLWGNLDHTCIYHFRMRHENPWEGSRARTPQSTKNHTELPGRLRRRTPLRRYMCNQR